VFIIPMTGHSPATPLATRLRNGLILGVALILTLAVFLGVNSQANQPSLTRLASSSMSYDTALANDRPTLLEFYANWCTSCQAMAGTIAEIKQQYGDRLNFVMLNVDNDKWLPEVLRYQVDGIPLFAFLNADDQAVGSSIGEQPRAILSANLNALLAQQPLPHVQNQGATSDFKAGFAAASRSGSDPRSHGAQVKDSALAH
jgi:thiol-disulfide isomerase/thioredoxin